MTHSAAFDAITLEQLRDVGGLKWSTYPDAIGAFVAEMDFGTAPPILAAMREAIDIELFGYLPESLAARMSSAWCGWAHEHYGWAVAAERVRPVGDVIAGLEATIEHFSVPDSPVIIPTPAYMPFFTVPPAMGRKVIQVPMARDDGAYIYDLDAIAAAYRAGGHLLVLCNPHNPTGRVLRREEMESVAEVVDRFGGRVFSDEIHAPLVYDGPRHVPYASISDVTAGHAVTAVSASKAWNLPGMKCAQLVLSNRADAEKWSRVGFMTEHGAANLGVVANIAAYEAGAPWLADVLSYLDSNRRLLGDLLAKHLPEVGYVPPEGTYLAWLDCRALGLGDHPAEFFLERARVALTDGPLCGEVGAGFARYNFATPRPILERTVQQLAQALHSG